MAEAAALAARRRVAAGVAGAPIALLVVDDECTVGEANLAACRLFGVSRDEIQGRALGELLSPAAAERLEGVWGAFHRTGGHAGPFELASSGAGQAVDVSVTAAVLPGLHLVLLSTSPAAPKMGGLANGGAPTPARLPTSRERQILGMLATGDTDAQIAAKLSLSPATVQTHVRNAKAKLGARTRAQAVAMSLRAGLIPVE